MFVIRLGPKRPRLMHDWESYAELRREVLERDGWRCQYCGTTQNLEVHHLVPRSQGGDDDAQNLITLCARCHGDVHLHKSFM